MTDPNDDPEWLYSGIHEPSPTQVLAGVCLVGILGGLFAAALSLLGIL